MNKQELLSDAYKDVINAAFMGVNLPVKSISIDDIYSVSSYDAKLFMDKIIYVDSTLGLSDVIDLVKVNTPEGFTLKSAFDKLSSGEELNLPISVEPDPVAKMFFLNSMTRKKSSLVGFSSKNSVTEEWFNVVAMNKEKFAGFNSKGEIVERKFAEMESLGFTRINGGREHVVSALKGRVNKETIKSSFISTANDLLKSTDRVVSTRELLSAVNLVLKTNSVAPSRAPSN